MCYIFQSKFSPLIPHCPVLVFRICAAHNDLTSFQTAEAVRLSVTDFDAYSLWSNLLKKQSRGIRLQMISSIICAFVLTVSESACLSEDLFNSVIQSSLLMWGSIALKSIFIF